MDYTTTRGKRQESPEQKLARELLKNSPEFKRLKESSSDKNKENQVRQFRQDKKEMINIIAILLDSTLSMNERLRRAGRAPANSSFVKEFKNNFIKFAKKNKKLFEKPQKQKKELLKGILNLTLKDFTFNALLNGVSNSVASALENQNKNTISNSNQHTITRTKEQENKIELSKKTRNKKVSRPLKKGVLTIYGTLNTQLGINNSKRPLITIPSKLNPFANAQTVENLTVAFNQVNKISQVEALKQQRVAESSNPKTVSVGRTITPPSSSGANGVKN